MDPTRLILNDSSWDTSQIREDVDILEIHDYNEAEFPFLDRFPNLKTLIYVNCYFLNKIKDLPSSLSTLTFNRCHRLGSLEGIQTCPSLKTVNLVGCEALESIKALASVPVEELTITECPSLATISFIKNHPSLKTIQVTGLEPTSQLYRRWVDLKQEVEGVAISLEEEKT